MLINKEGVWTSNDNWKFKDQSNGLIYIENTSKTKVLEATSDFPFSVIYEDLKAGDNFQLWIKGDLDAEDYFTLENKGLPSKVLTAISENSLEIQGMYKMNITK